MYVTLSVWILNEKSTTSLPSFSSNNTELVSFKILLIVMGSGVRVNRPDLLSALLLTELPLAVLFFYQNSYFY